MSGRSEEPRPVGGNLAGKTVLVAGGTGNVGRHLVGGMLEAGATVIVPSRSPEKLERLRATLGAGPGGRLVGIAGDLADEADGPRILDEAAMAGPLHAAVASLGRFIPAPSLLGAPSADLARALDDYLLAHFAVARAVLPRLRESGGSYVFINGPAAFEPFPGSALVSIATAGQAMLARALMDEMADEPVRVNEVVLYTAIGWGDADARSPVRPEDIGRYVAGLVSDRGAAVRARRLHLSSPEQLDLPAVAPAERAG